MRVIPAVFVSVIGGIALGAAAFLLIPHTAVPVHAGAEAAPIPAGTVLGMFAVSPAHNMINRAEKNPPTEWTAPMTASDKGTNIKWVAKLGSRAYALTVAGGKAFVGTNNHSPRNKRD